MTVDGHRRVGPEKGGVVLLYRRSPAQHTAEFAVCMGIAVGAAIALQHYAKRAVASGMGGVSDTILGEPVADPDRSLKGMSALQNTTLEEQGSAGVVAQVTTSERVIGNSLNEDAKLKIFPTTTPNTGTPGGPVREAPAWKQDSLNNQY